MKLLVILLSILTSVTIYAFEYRIEKKPFTYISSPAHESITALAISCLVQYEGEFPAKGCFNSLDSIGISETDKVLHFASIDDQPIMGRELLDAVSWPDDPTRQGGLHGLKAKINIELKCKNFLKYFGFLNYNDSINGGLFCNSHFGVLQFFHAQSSKPTKDDTFIVEPYDLTRRKILSWIRFNYEIVSKKERLNDSYCGRLSELRKDPLSRDFAEAFLPEAYKNSLFHCKNNFQVKWLYSNSCKNIFSSGTCTIVGDDRSYQITALGAILHVIQDSYAQGHTKRGTCSVLKEQPVSKVECLPIEQFYNYAMQDEKKHTSSDRLPISIADSCKKSDRVIDDVITATAKTLWYISHANDPDNQSALMQYLENSVFLNPYAAGEQPLFKMKDSAGACYIHK